MASSRIFVLPACSICQDDEAAPVFIVTPCGHVFHLGCIRTWDQTQLSRRTATKCPSCNVTIRRHSTNTPTRFITLHSLTERDINDQGVSHIINRVEDSATGSRLRNCLAELNSLKDLIKEYEAKIQQLGVEPVSLRREKESLTTSLMLLSHSKQELEQRFAIFSRELKIERKKHQEERNTRLMIDKTAKIEMNKLNEKYLIVKSQGEQLQDQLTKNISENEELQSFVAEFAQEKARLHAGEMALRAQLEDSFEKFRNMKAANQVYKNKVEELKKRNSKLEEKVASHAITGSVRRCSKFHPDVSKSSIYPAGVGVSSANRGADKSSSFKRPVRDVTHHLSNESSKRLRPTQATHCNTCTTSKEPARIEITSEPEDSLLPSSSTLTSSPIHVQADKDLYLPSLFGIDSTHPRQSRISLPHHLKPYQPSASTSSAIRVFKSSDKLLALGPKMRHK